MVRTDGMSTDLALPKLSERRALTRQKLLEATLAQMGEGGLHGVRSTPSPGARVSKGAIYDNFASKDAMIVTALASLPGGAGADRLAEGSKARCASGCGACEAVLAGQGDVEGRARCSEFSLYALTMRICAGDWPNRAMGPTRTKNICSTVRTRGLRCRSILHAYSFMA